MSIYIPYTYLIGWSKLDRWYYGVEYGQYDKVANPSNLWTTYFTSSKVVAQYRQKHGKPDVIEVRKTFKNSKNAIIWEQKVLKRMSVVSSKKWLNAHNSTPYIDFKHLSKESTERHRLGSQRGGLTNVKTGHCKRIAHLGGYIQGPKNVEQLRTLNKKKRKAVKVGDVIYESQTAAGKMFGIVAASVRDRIKSPNFPDWSYT